MKWKVSMEVRSTRWAIVEAKTSKEVARKLLAGDIVSHGESPSLSIDDTIHVELVEL